MIKALAQLLVILAVFFSLWFGLSRINWLAVLHVENAGRKTEQKLGRLLWEAEKNDHNLVKDSTVLLAVDSLMQKLISSNNIKDSIKLHVVESDEVNAFSFPDYHLVVTTGLIKESKNEDELSGVIGHELGHMEKDHVMKKLVKEFGLSVLISIGSGNSGGSEMPRQILKLLSSTAYDRKWEKEADLASVDYMVKADMDPEAFANFLYRQGDGSSHELLSWASTHPEAKERAAYVVDYIKTRDVHKKPTLHGETWDNMQKALAKEDK